MSEKNITSLNTIKTWFKTGLKPTQVQFWAWLDSFYHKDEEIPQDKITGLAETLENKAETSDLEVKANADATGLTDEQKQAWKETLEVGELPTNIALIDESGDDGSKLGNVYTKTQITELLENSGKNLGNTDLKVPEGTVRTLDTTAAKLHIKGLEDKTPDRSFNGRVVMNNLGQLAISHQPEIVSHFNMPQNINIMVSENFSNISFTPKPNYSREVLDALNFLKTIDIRSFVKFRTDEIIPYHIADEDLPSTILNDSERKRILQNLISVPAEGVLSYNGIKNKNFTELYTQEYMTAMSIKEKKAVFNVFFNKEFPEDKDWIISFYTDFPETTINYEMTEAYFGFQENKIEESNCDKNKGIILTGYGWSQKQRSIISNSNQKISINTQNIKTWIIKKGAILIIMIQSLETGEIKIDIKPYKTQYRYFYFFKTLETNTAQINAYYYNIKNISYWIAN